ITYILLIGAVGLDVMAFINLIVSDGMKVLLNNHETTKFLTTVLHNLINFCLNERFRWIHKAADILGLNDLLNEFMYKKTMNLDEDIKKFIVDELKTKSLFGIRRQEKMPRRYIQQKGIGFYLAQVNLSTPTILDSLSEDVEHDESLLLWHIATELCYQRIGFKIGLQNFKS
ncbi:Hypothetical predicted protein, partial [Olea europaea subsp. europaea]